MKRFFKRLYWRLYFAVYGAPTIEQVDAHLARLNEELSTTTRKPTQNDKCDCAIYTAAGDFLGCRQNIEEYKCHALAGNGDGVETNILQVGGCKSLGH